MLGYLSADIICSEKRRVFREQSSRKTVSYEEQIMSKDNYPCIFSPQMATIVFIILQIFFATRAIFKIGEYSRIFHSFSWGKFGHVTRLGQSRASEKIWWIINIYIMSSLAVCFRYQNDGHSSAYLWRGFTWKFRTTSRFLQIRSFAHDF